MTCYGLGVKRQVPILIRDPSGHKRRGTVNRSSRVTDSNQIRATRIKSMMPELSKRRSVVEDGKISPWEIKDER